MKFPAGKNFSVGSPGHYGMGAPTFKRNPPTINGRPIEPGEQTKPLANGNAGDINLMPGRGGTFPGAPPGKHGSIVLWSQCGDDGKREEMLRLCPDGEARVRGEVVASNAEVYERFLAWLEHAMCEGG